MATATPIDEVPLEEKKARRLERRWVVGVSVLALVAIAIGLGVGYGQPKAAPTPTSTVSVTVGPFGFDAQGAPLINPANVRCSLSNVTGYSHSSIIFTSYLDANNVRVSVGPTEAPLNSAMSCPGIGYTLASRRLFTITVKNETLTAHEATVVMVVPAAAASSVAEQINTKASSDPGFVLKNTTVIGGVSDGKVLQPAITPSNTPTPSVTSTVMASPSHSPSVTPSNMPTPSVSASVWATSTPSPSITRTVSPSPSIPPTRTPSPSITPTNSPSNSPAPVVPLIPWNVYPAPSGNWACVTYCESNGLFVAVGDSESTPQDKPGVMTSTNGRNWTAIGNAPNGHWFAVTCGGFPGSEVWVAVAWQPGRIMTSKTPNATIWTLVPDSAIPDPTHDSLNDVVYFNGTFYVIGKVGALKSTDGENWSLVWDALTNPLGQGPNPNYLRMAYGAGTFVAVSGQGTPSLIYSTDNAVTWYIVSGSTSMGDWQSITYGNGTFVAISTKASGNNMWTSADGISWTSRTVGRVAYNSVKYGGPAHPFFVAVGTDEWQGGVNEATLWGSMKAPVTDLGSITYGDQYNNTFFVAVGSNKVMISDVMMGR